VIWRSWSLLAGAPVGLLAGWVGLGLPPSPAKLALCALAGGLVLTLLLSVVSLARDRDPRRGARMAQAASAGLFSLPALAVALLQLAPGPGWLLGLCVALVLTAALRAALTRAPAPGLARQLRSALAYACGGGLLAVALAAAVSHAGAPRFAFDPARAAAIFDVDARVATRPIPRCAARPRSSRVLLERGAHPRLSEDGGALWFDARSESGERQVYRLELDSGREQCISCGEPGANLRPVPLAQGSGAIFETTRHARWWDPTNSELHLIRSRGGARGGEPSQRLTHHPGPDEHPVLQTASGLLIWTRRVAGRYEVVSAPLAGAHGAIPLGEPSRVISGGAAWIAPAAWSPDARSLVVLRGNPWGALEAFGLDLATGESAALGAGLASGAANFNADGGFVGLAGARRFDAPGLAPAGAGFLLAPFASIAERTLALAHGSELRLGEPRGAGSPLELGELADWGAPTGIALAPDGTKLLLGQRRTAGAEPGERLVEVELDCRL
jgi:hypothetical protein